LRKGGNVKRVLVRYKTKADKAEENENYIRKVFEELKEVSPKGIKYASFKLNNGLSFVHITSIETEDGSNPLGELPAFRKFQENIQERCEEPPVAVDLNEIGNYGICV
jgi:hypothetical protein